MSVFQRFWERVRHTPVGEGEFPSRSGSVHPPASSLATTHTSPPRPLGVVLVRLWPLAVHRKSPCLASLFSVELKLVPSRPSPSNQPSFPLLSATRQSLSSLLRSCEINGSACRLSLGEGRLVLSAADCGVGSWQRKRPGWQKNSGSRQHGAARAAKNSRITPPKRLCVRERQTDKPQSHAFNLSVI